MNIVRLLVVGALLITELCTGTAQAIETLTKTSGPEGAAVASPDLIEEVFKSTAEIAEPIIEAKPAVTLPRKTPVIVMLDEELSTETNEIGDTFSVTVLHDVLQDHMVVIPEGTKGYGEVTFVTGNGGFGKSGIIGISLRRIELDGQSYLLDGRYREEGKSKNGATVATWVAVGVFSGFIRGKDGSIPQGRELKARTGEEIAYSPPPVLAIEDVEPMPAIKMVGGQVTAEVAAVDVATALGVEPNPPPAKTEQISTPLEGQNEEYQ